MKVFTTTSGKDFTILHAASFPSGQWNRIITLDVKHGARRSNFQAVTGNMRGYYKAKDMDWGQEFFEALFKLIESEIEAEISEWINE